MTNTYVLPNSPEIGFFGTDGPKSGDFGYTFGTCEHRMSNDLLAPSFLFRFLLPVRRTGADWSACAPLGDEHRLLSFTALDDARHFADVRGAWNDRGMAFSVSVRGKKHPPWCRANRFDESDGFHLWLDTRDTKNIHRASRFCHHFVFLPSGGGNRYHEPVAEQLLINRARENANPIRPGVLGVQSEKRVDGYALDCFVPWTALTGFDREDYPRMGLFYAVVDRELGEQTLAYSSEVPFREDPSVWCSLEYVDSSPAAPVVGAKRGAKRG